MRHAGRIRGTKAAGALGALLALASTGGQVIAQDADVSSLGATEPRYESAFSSAEDWGTLDEPAAVIGLQDGGLRFDLREDDLSRWSWHDLGMASTVQRVGVTAEFGPGSGAAGPMCGSGGSDPSFLVGVVNTDGEWVLLRIVASRSQIIDRGPVPGPGPADGGRVRLELECAVTGTGGDRLLFLVDGVTVADVTDTSVVGPFTRSGLYARVATAPFRVTFDDVAVLGGDTYAPQSPTDLVPATPSPSRAPFGALIDAVPAALRADCRAVAPDAATGQLGCRPLRTGRHSDLGGVLPLRHRRLAPGRLRSTRGSGRRGRFWGRLPRRIRPRRVFDRWTACR